MDPTFFKEFVTSDIASGRTLGQGDVKAIVISDGIANNVFSKPLAVGHILSIGNIPFRVIGILESSTGFGGGNNQIYMSLNDARDVLSETLELEPDEFSSIEVKINDADFADETVAKMETTLMNVRHVRENKKDFTVTSPTALQERFSEVSS